MNNDTSRQDFDLLKQLKAAGKHRRTIQATNIRVALDRLAKGGFVIARPTVLKSITYRITVHFSQPPCFERGSYCPRRVRENTTETRQSRRGHLAQAKTLSAGERSQRQQRSTRRLASGLRAAATLDMARAAYIQLLGSLGSNAEVKAGSPASVSNSIVITGAGP